MCGHSIVWTQQPERGLGSELQYWKDLISSFHRKSRVRHSSASIYTPQSPPGLSPSQPDHRERRVVTSWVWLGAGLVLLSHKIFITTAVNNVLLPRPVLRSHTSLQIRGCDWHRVSSCVLAPTSLGITCDRSSRTFVQDWLLLKESCIHELRKNLTKYISEFPCLIVCHGLHKKLCAWDVAS